MRGFFYAEPAAPVMVLMILSISSICYNFPSSLSVLSAFLYVCSLFNQTKLMRTTLLILLSVISFNCFSQDLEEVSGVAVYFKAGVNYSNFVSWDDDEPTEAIFGPSGGMGLYIPLSKPKRKSTSLAVEGIFSGQGFKLTQNDVTIKARTTYFNLSAGLRQYFGHMYITAGGERAFLMGAKEVYETESEDVPEGIYHKGAWNGFGGIGVNFGTKNSRQVDFGFELTYKHGLGPVRTDFVKARQSVYNLSMFIPVSFIADMAAGF